MTAPGVPYAAFDGFHWESVRDTSWRRVAGKRCRFTTGPGRATCREPSVAEFQRGRQWWAYCGAHLFGRWLSGGEIMHWIMRPDVTP